MKALVLLSGSADLGSTDLVVTEPGERRRGPVSADAAGLGDACRSRVAFSEMAPGSSRTPIGRLVIGGFVVAGSVLVGGACSSAPGPGIADGPPTDLGDTVVDLTGDAEVTVSMGDNIYEPRVARVDPGATVTFVNQGAQVHNATPNEDGALVAVSLAPTESGEITLPTTPGTYRFYCTLHATKNTGRQRGAFIIGA